VSLIEAVFQAIKTTRSDISPRNMVSVPEVECLLSYLPYDPHRDEDYQRETFEAELRWLWSRRNEISEQLQPYPALAS
jgi:hypothetical protein